MITVDHSLGQKLYFKKIKTYSHMWFHAFEQLAEKTQYATLLESNEQGRYSVMAFYPSTIIVGKDHSVTQIERTKRTYFENVDPLWHVKKWMDQNPREEIEGAPPMQSGVIGFISYDYGRFIEKLPSIAQDDLKTPDVYFSVYDHVIVIDHKQEVLWIFIYASPSDHDRALKFMEEYERLFSKNCFPRSYRILNAHPMEKKETQPFSKDRFIEAVNRSKEYILQGDVFQVNLSVRRSESLYTEPLHIYSKLRKMNPSPYMAYIQTPHFHVVSGSPELLIKKDGQHLMTRPIAGTRSRGRTKQEDDQLMNDLRLNEKEQAEHLMLVDLERNDLGRISQFGSVHVSQFMAIEKYSHVMHIVSQVEGKSAFGTDSFHVLRAMFPGGTITGAPKVRTMEIIEELEPTRRGIYTGSIGWFNFSGNMEFNIAIRTMYIKDGQAYVQAGAGIVADSIPEAEYKESLKKAKALWLAKEMSEAERALELEEE